MNKPLKISIITPSLNCAEFVQGCIDSVLKQNYPLFEHIIVDGRSTDGTVDILKRHPHLKWICEPDQGEIQALNNGLQQATGDIIGWLNADDLYMDNIFHDVADLFQRRGNCHLLYGKTMMIDEDGFPTHSWVPYSPLNTATLLRWYQLYLSQPSIFFSADLFKTVGLLREDLNYGADYEYWLRIAHAKFKFFFCDRYLSKARLFRASGKTKTPYATKAREWFEISKRYAAHLPPCEQLSFFKDYYIFRYQNRSSLYKGEPMPIPDVKNPADVNGWVIATRALRMLSVTELMSLIQECPKATELYTQLGETLRLEGHWQEASKAFNVALSKDLKGQPAEENTNLTLIRKSGGKGSFGNKSKRRVMIFCPEPPSPAITGARRVFNSQIATLKEFGYAVTLISSTLASVYWPPSTVREVEQSLKVSTAIHQGGVDDLIWKHHQGIRWPDPDWKLQHAPSLNAFFRYAYDQIKPDLVLINYANWGQLACRHAFAASKRIICAHDLLKVNKQIEMALAPHFQGFPEPNEVHEVVLDDRFKEFVDLQVDMTREYETYESYDVTLSIAHADTEPIRRNTSSTTVAYIPAVQFNGQDVDNQYCAPPVFVGSGYLPNFQGYYYYVRKVLPLLQQRISDFTLRLVGRGFLDLPPQRGIKRMGYVKSLEQVYAGAKYAICPLLIGTGTQIKIIEAMAFGLPVVVHAGVADRTPVRHAENGFVAENCEAFADYMLRLENDPGLCRQLGQAAKKTVKEAFSKQNHLARWHEVLKFLGHF